MLCHSSLFFKFWISCQDVQKLNKVEFAFFKCVADAYPANATDCFYGFWNMQKTELCMLQLSAFFHSINHQLCLSKTLKKSTVYWAIIVTRFIKSNFLDEIDQPLYEKSVEISYQQHWKNFQGISLYWILENWKVKKKQQQQKKQNKR